MLRNRQTLLVNEELQGRGKVPPTIHAGEVRAMYVGENVAVQLQQ